MVVLDTTAITLEIQRQAIAKSRAIYDHYRVWIALHLQ